MTTTTRQRYGGEAGWPTITPAELAGMADRVREGDHEPLVLAAVDLDDLEDLTHRDVSRIVTATPAVRPILLGVRNRPLPVDFVGPGQALLEHLSLTLVPLDLVAGGRFPHGHMLATGFPTCVPVTDPGVTAASIAQRVLRHRNAALVLDELLRVVPRGSVTSGLIAEAQAYSLLLTGVEYRTWALGRRSDRRPPAPPATGADQVMSVTRVRDELQVTLDWRRARFAADPAAPVGMDHTVRRMLAALLRSVPDDVNLIELRGAGPDFCPDCRPDVPPAGDPPTAHLRRRAAGLAHAAHRAHDRLIVYVDGRCVGSGLELAAFARRVQAGSNARFRMPQLEMGLIPGAGGTVSLTKRIGQWRTAYLLLSGAWIDAETAWRWGLVDGVEAPGAA